MTEENELASNLVPVKIMTDPKLYYSPLKIGILIVSIVYSLFTFHALFTLAWIGEWTSFTGPASFWILISDISASIGLVFRLIASLTAVAAIIFYLAKKGLSAPTTLKILRLILVAEAIYWLPLLVSGVMGVLPILSGGSGSDGSTQAMGLPFILGSLIAMGIPCLVEAIAVPFALFKLVFELNPNKPMKGAIKWGLIAGTVYVFVLWLNNTGMWIYTIMQKGTEYLTSYPENLLSFALTTIGLLALVVFTAYFSKKSIGTENLEMLKLKTIGAIIVALGLYFFWNYLTWIFFGRPELWSDWYAWFLGHNMDLWVLSIPLVGLPLLFEQNAS